MPAKILARIEAEMHLAQLQVKQLLVDIEIESPYTLMTLDPDEYGGPQGVARAVRSFWRLPNGPVGNLVRVVEAAGAVVLLRHFGTRKLDGMSCWAKSTPPLFFLNSDEPAERQRWIIAHELGHLIMHSTPPDSDPEQQAEDFARELLLPTAETSVDLRKLTFQRLPALKQVWRVPMKELITAASRRAALPASKVKSLSVQYSRAGWNNREPYPISPEVPSLVDAAVRVHLDEHGYTTEELAAISDLLPDPFIREYAPARRLNVV
jgi:Zn-dependent peptidase ImmA (M78 family)